MFISISPPISWAHHAIALARSLEPPHDARITDAASVHLTVLFIGETPERDMPDLRRSVECAAAPIAPFELTPTAVTPMPGSGSARSLAILCAPCGALTELHRRLVARLARRPRNTTRFLPHLTVMRCQPGSMSPRRTPADASPLGPFPADEVRVMRSVLRPDGAVHTTDHAVRLRAR